MTQVLDPKAAVDWQAELPRRMATRTRNGKLHWREPELLPRAFRAQSTGGRIRLTAYWETGTLVFEGDGQTWEVQLGDLESRPFTDLLTAISEGRQREAGQ